MTKTPGQWKEEEKRRLRELREIRNSAPHSPSHFVKVAPVVEDDGEGMPKIAEPPKPAPPAEAPKPKRKRGRPRKDANADSKIRKAPKAPANAET